MAQKNPEPFPDMVRKFGPTSSRMYTYWTTKKPVKDAAVAKRRIAKRMMLWEKEAPTLNAAWRDNNKSRK